MAASLITVTSPPPRCTLLGLPAELRNSIWELVVLWRQDVRIGISRSDRYVALPPLLRVNKQIRRETLPKFFDSKKFILYFEFTETYVPSSYPVTTSWIHAVGSLWPMVETLHINFHDVTRFEHTLTVDFSKKTLWLGRPCNTRFAWSLCEVDQEVRRKKGEGFLLRKEGSAIQSAEDAVGFLLLL